jgi:hypothetical protein
VVFVRSKSDYSIETMAAIALSLRSVEPPALQ